MKVERGNDDIQPERTKEQKRLVGERMQYNHLTCSQICKTVWYGLSTPRTSVIGVRTFRSMLLKLHS